MADEKLPNPFHKLFARMMDTFAEYQWKALLRSHFLAEPEEKKARLAAIRELSVELAKIEAVSIQSTRFGARVIECIVEGNWKEAEEYNSDLAFDEFPEPDRTFYAQLWEKFRAITMAACAEAKRREAGQASPGN